jgi:alpha-D-ribose 1-methylphosphonate 5-phosphate C-P lyase
MKTHGENVNVSAIFDSLALLVTDKNKLDTLLPIPSFFSNMMRSQARVDTLTQFLGAGTEARVYNISQISELLSDAFSQNHVLTIRIRHAEVDTFEEVIGELLSLPEMTLGK